MPKTDYKFMNEETRGRLFEALGLGLPVASCCEYAGIHYQTYHSWLKKGEAEIQVYEAAVEDGLETALGPYGEFFREVGRIKGGVIKKYVEVIEKAASNPTDPDWKAASEFLKMRFPETWGKKVIENKVDVDINLREISYEELERRNNQSLIAMKDYVLELYVMKGFLPVEVLPQDMQWRVRKQLEYTHGK